MFNFVDHAHALERCSLAYDSSAVGNEVRGGDVDVVALGYRLNLVVGRLS